MARRHGWRRARVARGGRGPLNVMFVLTECFRGGAEVLLLELLRHLDRARFAPRVATLKKPGSMGKAIGDAVPLTSEWLKHKYDARVIGRLARHMRETATDAVVTVGTGGDRMFWGRLAAWRARVPVILSAIHSTGYPHGIELANRLLTPITDGFIACARRHARYLIEYEHCPAERVFAIPNGVDTRRFRPRDRVLARARMGWDAAAPIAGIVAALRPEKQHVLLIEAWADVVRRLPEAQLIIVGDGSERAAIEEAIARHRLHASVTLLGCRDDVPELLPAFDAMVLSSKMEANPASTLEASACGVAVVAPDVGSLPETVVPGKTGLLYPGSDRSGLVEALLKVLGDRSWARRLGEAGRRFVQEHFALEVMVCGYERLIEGLYEAAWTGQAFRPEDLEVALANIPRCTASPSAPLETSSVEAHD